MSGPADFLARWSQRKRAEAEARRDAGPAQDPSATPNPTATAAEPEPAPPPAAASVFDPAVFDPTSLPAVESITAETDIRGFFAPGVPAELARAALRRAWSADPNIRDFVGLSENSWDFCNPDSIPGFGTLEMTPELKREIARMFSNLDPEEQTGEPVPVQPPPEAAPASPPTAVSALAAPPTAAVTPAAAAGHGSMVPAAGNPGGPEESSVAEPGSPSNSPGDCATQQIHKPLEALQVAARRGHGGALPQ